MASGNPDSNRDLVNELHRRGLRCTRNRHRLLRLLENSPRPLSRSELLDRLQPPPDRVSLYRALRDLEAAGLLRAVNTPEGRRWGLRSRPHAHFTCNVCGRALCLEDTRPPEVALPPGYRAEAVELHVSGVCPRCRAGR
ncbi:MAG: transcriptional repressor [Candidatus Coatesbacteria bacterium]|nr:transcriptional repressor [Candidatus Coatesbacteria bacterium]